MRNTVNMLKRKSAVVLTRSTDRFCGGVVCCLSGLLCAADAG